MNSNIHNPSLSEEDKEIINDLKEKSVKKSGKFLNKNLLKLSQSFSFNKMDKGSIFKNLKLFIGEFLEYLIEHIPDFAIKYIIVTLITIVYFCVGSSLLYICKVAKTNYLPVFGGCFPYTSSNLKMTTEDYVTNLLTSNINGEDYSINLKFNYEENKDNIVLDAIRNYTESTSGNKILIYFLSIITEVIKYNYNVMDIYLNNIGKLPDLLVVILSPILYTILIIFLFITNNIYTVFLWFYKMEWFFKSNVNCGKRKVAKWENISMFKDPIGYYMGLVFTGIGLILSIFVVLSLIFMPFTNLPVLSIGYTFLSAMGFKSSVKTHYTSIITIMWNTMKYFKAPIFLSTCIFTVFRSKISDKLFDLYHDYNKEKTTLLINATKNAKTMDRIMNKTDVFNLNQYGDDNTRKLNNQLDMLYRNNRKLNNTTGKVADVLEDAYNVNIPFSILILCIIFSVASSLDYFSIRDYSLFSRVIIESKNVITCDGEELGEGDEHTALYKTYMFGRSIFNNYKTLINARKESMSESRRQNTTAVPGNVNNETKLSSSPSPDNANTTIDPATNSSTDNPLNSTDKSSDNPSTSNDKSSTDNPTTSSDKPSTPTNVPSKETNKPDVKKSSSSSKSTSKKSKK